MLLLFAKQCLHPAQHMFEFLRLCADIAALASRYLVLCTPCLFLTTAMECTRRYLQAQRAVKPTMAVGEGNCCLMGLGVHSSIVLSLWIVGFKCIAAASSAARSQAYNGRR
jgi:hypothetical protein